MESIASIGRRPAPWFVEDAERKQRIEDVVVLVMTVVT